MKNIFFQNINLHYIQFTPVLQQMICLNFRFSKFCTDFNFIQLLAKVILFFLKRKMIYRNYFNKYKIFYRILN